MKLCSELMSLSAARTNARTADDDTPWASGLLRSRSAAAQGETARTRRTAKRRTFIPGPRNESGRRGSIKRAAVLDCDTGRQPVSVYALTVRSSLGIGGQTRSPGRISIEDRTP